MEPNEAAVQIDAQDMIAELTTIVGNLNQELAGTRVVVRKQREVIEALQEELVAKGAGGEAS